jgi:selenocysteine-specific elongation factor
MENNNCLEFLLNEDELKKVESKNVININVGILGHVDSGKTSIARILSQITSTASLDKNPQS